ncbi:MAG: hotdog domain-containing protein [Polyangiales bacterium]
MEVGHDKSNRLGEPLHGDLKHRQEDGERISYTGALPPAETHLDEWIAPQQCDERGHLRAGQILEWMDVVGVVAASRHTRSPIVTASVDGVELLEPILVGERVTMTAQVAYTSERSVGVSVSMTHGAPGAPTRHMLNGWMTFVGVDDAGRPIMVPPVLANTPAQLARLREGQLRREFRRKLASGTLTDIVPESLPRGSDERRLFVTELLKLIPRMRVPWEGAVASRSRQHSYVHSIEPVRPDSLNFHGTLYGGIAMRWIESNAQLSARAYLRGAAVRCSGLHGLSFLKPAQRDMFVHLRSMVVHATDAQLTVLVTMESEDPAVGQITETLRAFLTYAPVERTQSVPKVECGSDEERALHAEVEHRLALQRSLAGDKRDA